MKFFGFHKWAMSRVWLSYCLVYWVWKLHFATSLRAQWANLINIIRYRAYISYVRYGQLRVCYQLTATDISCFYTQAYHLYQNQSVTLTLKWWPWKVNQLEALSPPMCVPNLRTIQPVHFDISYSHHSYQNQFRQKLRICPNYKFLNFDKHGTCVKWHIKESFFFL